MKLLVDKQNKLACVKLCLKKVYFPEDPRETPVSVGSNNVFTHYTQRHTADTIIFMYFLSL